MSKKLVIVESPAKAKTIGKILGEDYIVKSSVGHIRDLPERSLGVDVEHGFEPKYVVASGKAKVISELQKCAKTCDAVYLAPDPDREGEAIAWHLHEVLESAAKDKPFLRVQYNEITPRAVKAAFEHPSSINMERVNAQQARRVLDRLVGYKVSPLLWRQVKKGLSAGRVQSVALRLVCEREREILDFKVEPYWVMGASLKKGSDGFTVKLAKVDGEKPLVGSEAAAQAILSDLEGRRLEVSDVRVMEKQRRPLPPFITSTLQQAASSVCSFSPSRTMSLAQSLYEGVDLGSGATGLITYMRTDSTAVARDAQETTAAYIRETFGTDYCPEKFNSYRNRESAQGAHEAIRPTDVARTPESLKKFLKPAELRLYDLIWRRFVASQMTPARVSQRTVEVASVPPPAQKHRYLFTASATEVVFQGFLKVMALDIRRKKPDRDDDTSPENEDEVDKLPEVAKGDPVDLVEWLSERKETKPPSRYSEASLIRALEADGVGRPSTYASIIETLDARKYIKRENRQIAPMEIGFKVNDLLVTKLGQLFDVGFTAEMEEKLDKVEEGEIDWTQMLSDFYSHFALWLEQSKEPPADAGKVAGVLALLQRVKEWSPPVKFGRRTFDDGKFVTSIQEQIDEGEKPVSEKQLATLVKMAIRYRTQVPGMLESLTALGFESLVEDDSQGPSEEQVRKRFELFDAMDLSDNEKSFMESLRTQAENGRKMSPAQIQALDRMLLRNAAQIEDFEEKTQGIGLVGEKEPAAEGPDLQSADLLEALSHVAEWSAPTAQGKRVYDDKAFFESLNTQYSRKKFLSPRQRMALGRMVGKYSGQIPGFAELSVKYGIKARAAKPAASAAAETAASGDVPADEPATKKTAGRKTAASRRRTKKSED